MDLSGRTARSPRWGTETHALTSLATGIELPQWRYNQRLHPGFPRGNRHEPDGALPLPRTPMGRPEQLSRLTRPRERLFEQPKVRTGTTQVGGFPLEPGLPMSRKPEPLDRDPAPVFLVECRLHDMTSPSHVDTPTLADGEALSPAGCSCERTASYEPQRSGPVN